MSILTPISVGPPASLNVELAHSVTIFGLLITLCLSGLYMPLFQMSVFIGEPSQTLPILRVVSLRLLSQTVSGESRVPAPLRLVPVLSDEAHLGRMRLIRVSAQPMFLHPSSRLSPLRLDPFCLFEPLRSHASLLLRSRPLPCHFS